MIKARALAMLASLPFLAAPAWSQPQGAYKSVLVAGNFEIRDYPARTVAELTIDGPLRVAAYNGFRILADPTLPPGRGDETVVLTTPVTEQAAPSVGFASDQIRQERYAYSWIVRFDAASAGAAATPAGPHRSAVRRVDLPPTRMAVLRYDGRGGVWAAGLNPLQASYALMTQVARRGLTMRGPFILAQYNSPDSRPVFRHFAVMVALDHDAP